LPDAWHVMGVTLSAGGSFRWFRDALGGAEKQVALLSGVDPYEILTAEAAQAPAGSEGLLFLPYLTGERAPYPDPNARGVYFGLTLRHDQRHMVRAVLEGVAYSLRDSVELFRELGVPIRQVRATGGGARSLLWRQILADVFGTQLVTVDVTDSTAFGAALLAGVGTEVYANVPEACRATVKVVDEVQPDAQRQATYDAYYRVYHSLYAPLRQAFKEVSSIDMG